VRFRYLLLAAFLALSSGPARADSGATEPPILRRGNGTEVQSLDPHLVSGVPAMRVLRALYEGLVTLDPESLEPRPAVAESWEISPDGRRYTFRLDPEARWSNGDPVTAEDFRESFLRILHPSLAAPYASQLFVLEGAEAYYREETTDPAEVGVRAPGRHTLVLTLESPTPYFLSLLVNAAWYPVHRPSVEATGAWLSRQGDWTRPGRLVSNGAFHLAEWKLNEYLRVVRNPHYRAPQRYHLAEIFFFPIENVFTEERAFADGLLDVTSLVSTPRIRDYLEGEGRQALRVEPDLGVYYLLLNTRVPPLDDPRVRRALSLALDRRAVTRDIRRRGEPPARHFTPEGIGGYRPPDRVQEDAEEARALLREAGYGPDRPFPRLTYLFNTSETHRPIAETIQALWKERLGIEIELVNKEWKSYLADRRRRDFAIARAGWLGDYLDPDTFLGLWTSGSTHNFSGWSSAAYDEAMARAARLPAGAERNSWLARAEEELLSALPVIPVFFYNRAYLVRPTVRHWPENLLGYTDYSGIRILP